MFVLGKFRSVFKGKLGFRGGEKVAKGEFFGEKLIYYCYDLRSFFFINFCLVFR